MRVARFVAAVGLVITCFPATALPAASGQGTTSGARVYEETLVLPTYLVEKPEPNPMFYSGRAYQGAKGPVYPYPFLDLLTDTKQDKSYRAVYLENAYLKLCVLPELGGRLFSAQDKTNGYDFIYRQHVIKPALIGMLGAWISGGVEWNVPHHHRATTFMPVDHVIVNSPDGSATVWVGETELRHRTRWLVGLTLRPDSSAIEVTVKVINRTAAAQSMLWFANAAIHANPDYQVIFPPDTTLAAFHGKNQFSNWPFSTEIFNGQDYSRGVDVSWWKNHARPTSFFAFDGQGDFLAGYDHGKSAGICFVGDHNVVPGKKIWTWGIGPEGALWETILTDADGPYAELMFGAWSDNQPDYSWTQPLETRTVKQWWYPLRGIGGVKAATKDAACDLTVIDGRKARLAVHATRPVPDARVVLSVGVRSVHEERVGVGPDKPFVREVEIPEGIDPRELSLTLWSDEGRPLVRYDTVKRIKPPLPPAVTPPSPPQDIASIEELYLTGLRLEQFQNPAVEPYPYYEEALRRDPGDYRTNIALGILHLKRGMALSAEEMFARAVARATKNYTRPKDGEALYYLGVARRTLGRFKEAREAFQRAAWDEHWQAAGYFESATLACREGEYGEALDLLQRARAKNAASPEIAVLTAAVQRKMGYPEAARATAAESLALDPLSFWGWNETALIRSALNPEEGKAILKRLAALMRDAPANYLETAADYLRCGLWDEAAEVLERLIGMNKKGSSDFPLVHYMAAYALNRKGDAKGAEERLRTAAACPPDYGFPFQLEFLDILTWAKAERPNDPRAPYYLGNLLFDIQPDAAVAEWEKAAALDPKFSIARRNLGLAYARVKNDLPGALKELEAAVAAAPEDAKLYEELDRLHEAAGTPWAKRLALLEKNHKIVARRDDALAREAGLLVQAGRFGRAIEILETNHFNVWEGSGGVYGLFVEAHLQRGEDALSSRKWREALADFEAARTYPRNFDVAEPRDGGGSARIFHLIGLAQEGLGNAAKAREAFEKAASYGHGPSEAAYFEALALRKLGREKEAAEKLDGLRKAAESRLQSAPAMDFFEKFGEKQSAAAGVAEAHFWLGLAFLGQGNNAAAADEFKAALAANPNHLGAARQSTRLAKKG
jgi:tetratricopeptide (TPR) repeat protein